MLKPYLGAKIILAEPMPFVEFKDKFGHFGKSPDNEPGYHVVYPAAHSGEQDYHSWSPAVVFEEAYRLLNAGETAFVVGHSVTMHIGPQKGDYNEPTKRW